MMKKETAIKLATAAVLVLILAAIGAIFGIMLGGGEKTQAISIPPEVPGEVVYIPFPVRVKVDGNLDDWQGVPSVLVTQGPMLSTDPGENGSFIFSLAADKENLYITMQMTDRTIVAGQHGQEFWNEDSMEFYVNASGDLAAAKYAPGMFQVNINAADIGNTDPDALTITGVFSTGVSVHGYVFKTEKGWGFEVSTPLEGLIQPEHGAEIGFQAQINGASFEDRDIKLIWSNLDTSDRSWETPYLFGRGIFYEIGRTDVPQPSVVTGLPTPVATLAPRIIPALISVNQVGYFPAGQKIALLANTSESEVPWQLLDASGAEVAAGTTTWKGLDRQTGDSLHIIDFTAFTTPGTGYSLAAGGLVSVPFDISLDLYTPLGTDAMSYFYLNRSGMPLEAEYALAWARPAGHLSDASVTCWQGVDADEVAWPGCEYSLDVSGGWYDAGDYGKYVVNGGISAWLLMDTYERFPAAYRDGSLRLPENSNALPDILDEARWEMEFLLSMQVPAGDPLAGMAHHKMHDEAWSAVPSLPPEMVDNDPGNVVEGVGRYLYPPSTTATLNLAAAGAKCARVWAELDPAFSARCLSAAESAYQAALAHPDLYAGDTPGTGGGNYSDIAAQDEFLWAATELYLTTAKGEYEAAVLEAFQFGRVEAFDWGHTATLSTLALAHSEAPIPAEARALLQTNLVAYADELLPIQAYSGYGMPIEGDLPWGSNAVMLSNMILMAQVYDLTGEARYLDSARSGMDYLLGRNAFNMSFVTGTGTYPAEHPHHRFWANDPAAGYPPPPAGALVGGANSSADDERAQAAGLEAQPAARRYVDAIDSYSTNEVAINWNAALVWMSTYLQQTAAQP